MPAGVPVATVAVGGARNAGLLAVRILAATDPALRDRMAAFQADLAGSVLAKDAALQEAGHDRRAIVAVRAAVVWRYTGEEVVQR